MFRPLLEVQRGSNPPPFSLEVLLRVRHLLFLSVAFLLRHTGSGGELWFPLSYSLSPRFRSSPPFHSSLYVLFGGFISFPLNPREDKLVSFAFPFYIVSPLSPTAGLFPYTCTGDWLLDEFTDGLSCWTGFLFNFSRSHLYGVGRASHIVRQILPPA